MSSTLHKTRGIVLRTVKYGETSLIVNVYTELFGLQAYLVQGVRTSTKKGSGKANYFFPGAVLDMVVYHHALKQLQRIKEFKWAWLYRRTLQEVVRNSVLLYMMELVQKCIRQPEHNPELFAFIEDALLHLDDAEGTVLANFPLYFSIHLSSFFGFRINDEDAGTSAYLDLREGRFVHTPPTHRQILEGEAVTTMAELLKVMQPQELKEIPLHHQQRRLLLETLEQYYALHMPEFGKMKSLSVLQEVLSA